MPYRSRLERDYPEKSAAVKRAIGEFHAMVETCLDKEQGNAVRILVPNQLKVAKGILFANLGEAEAALVRDDYEQSVVHLEIALTTLHNFILQVVNAEVRRQP